MSHAINWAVCPAATHYLKSGFGHLLSQFYKLVDGVIVCSWDNQGAPILFSPSALKDMPIERMIKRPAMDISDAPAGATHFLAAERVEDTAWFRMVGDRVQRWFPVDGDTKHFGWSPIDFLPPMSEAIPSAQAPDIAEPDWSSAPERATHFVYSTRTTVEPGWYVADGVKMRLVGRDDEYTFRLDDVHPTCGLTLVERPPVAPDWGTAPKYATHYAPRVTLDAFHYPPLWLKAEDGSYLKAVWENDWFWRPYGALPKGRAETLIARPMAEPAPFSPDWDNAPEDATHHTRDKCEAPWRKVVGGDVFMWHRGAWELVGMPAGLGDYVQRPSVKFVPYGFRGSVLAHGLPRCVKPWEGELPPPGHPVDYLGIDGEWKDGSYVGSYLGQAVVACRESGAVGFLDYSSDTMTWEVDAVVPWNGEGNPPVGTDCVVTPHNNQWGFEYIQPHRCRVLGYHHEAVWLVELHSDGAESLAFISSRTDKVDFAPHRTPEQVASDERIEAAQVWLKGVEEQYGKEAADKCEDILMDFEKRKKAEAAS